MADSKYFGVPFASTGDRAAIPTATDPGGALSYQQGFGPDYERDPATDPLAKRVPRDETNEYLYQITNALKYLQLFGAPEWYDDDGAGVPVSYPIGAKVRHLDQNWISLVAANTATPGTDATKWTPSDAFSKANSGLNLLTFSPSAGAVLNGVSIPWVNGGAWVVPDGVTRLKLRVWGAGGGGGGSSGNGSAGSGGGGGGYAEGSFAVEPGTSILVTAGAGGAGGAGGGTSADGVAGGQSRFASLIICGAGGFGRRGQGAIQTGGLGGGGSVTGGSVQFNGQPGGYGFFVGGDSIHAGVGGAAFGGQGATPIVAPVSTSAAGFAGSTPGVGGGGGIGGGAGGAGGGGLVIVEF